MHTLDAPGAVERLKDLGCDEKSLEEVLMGVLAQRLVRQSLPSNHLEYKGRLGIFEYLDFRTKRLASLREDAMSKMKKGLTSDEEIQRVLGVD